MSTGTAAMNADPAVRPFHVDIAEEAIADLRRRIAAWRPPDREPVDDQSQGVQLATVQHLANYWATEHDWRRCQAKLNTLPQFMTTIDGLDIHFIHVRSPQQNALPLIVSHGWPGSIIEQLKIIEPLINPTEHGGTASDAFDVVIPSLPGYGFSGKPAATGWGPDRIARAWAVLADTPGHAGRQPGSGRCDQVVLAGCRGSTVRASGGRAPGNISLPNPLSSKLRQRYFHCYQSRTALPRRSTSSRCSRECIPTPQLAFWLPCSSFLLHRWVVRLSSAAEILENTSRDLIPRSNFRLVTGASFLFLLGILRVEEAG